MYVSFVFGALSTFVSHFFLHFPLGRIWPWGAWLMFVLPVVSLSHRHSVQNFPQNQHAPSQHPTAKQLTDQIMVCTSTINAPPTLPAPLPNLWQPAGCSAWWFWRCTSWPWSCLKTLGVEGSSQGWNVVCCTWGNDQLRAKRTCGTLDCWVTLGERYSLSMSISFYVQSTQSQLQEWRSFTAERIDTDTGI